MIWNPLQSASSASHALIAAEMAATFNLNWCEVKQPSDKSSGGFTITV